MTRGTNYSKIFFFTMLYITVKAVCNLCKDAIQVLCIKDNIRAECCLLYIN